MRRSALLLLLSPALAFSAECKCPTVTPQDQMEAAAYVFRARLADVTLPKKDVPAFVFDVNDTFKGEPPLELLVQDAERDTPCALSMETGKEYLVYVRWQWGLYKTSRCWGTKAIEQANADRAVIGPGDEWKAKLYPKLRQTCMGTYVTPCCLASVRAMELGRFMPEPNNGCPDGMKPNVAACQGSLRWCEPIAGNPAHQP